ncbi:MAG: CHASE2 domain-containing protein [Cyanobacteria bacterium P01_F01_bin.56]
MKKRFPRQPFSLNSESFGYLLPGFLIVIAVCLARFSGLLEPFELFYFDLLMNLRLPEAQDERFFLINIDEDDMAAMGNPSTIPTEEWVNLLNEIQTYEPAVIGFKVLTDLIEDGPENQALNDLIAQQDNIIVPEKILPPFIYPLSQVDDSRVGFVDALPDRDNKLRRSLLGSRDVKEDTFKFSFTLLLAKHYLEARGHKLINGEVDESAMQFGDTEIPRLYPNTGGYSKIDNGGVQAIVNYRNGQTPFKKVSLQEFKTKQFEPSDLTEKIVIIDTSIPRLRFSISTPLNSQVDSLEVSAHFISQIISSTLDDRPLIKASKEVCEYVLFGLFGLFFIVATSVSKIKPNVLLISSLGCFLLFFSIGYFSFASFGYWLVLAPQGITMLLWNLVYSLIYSQRAGERIRMEETLKIETERARADDRKRTIERAFEAIHNGPLQELSIMLKGLQDNKEFPDITEPLKKLSQDIRNIGKNLEQNFLESEESLYLNEDCTLDLNNELHELFYLVYSETLERDFPVFRSAKKIRSFDPIRIEICHDTKRDLCRFLEESICNIGKHSPKTSKISVLGKWSKEFYELIIENELSSLNNMTVSSIDTREGEGTRQARRLAMKIDGQFFRYYMRHKVVCILKWKL